MRTDYFLGQNRGDDYRNSIKSYSLQAWRDAGGEDGHEPKDLSLRDGLASD